MTAIATPDDATVWRSLPREAMAGVVAAITALPTSLASGLLAFAPFGPQFSAHGAAAGLMGAIVGGFVAALAARSSFIVSVPRTGVALVQAGLAAALVSRPPFAANPELAFLAVALSVALAGVLQIGFGLLGLGRIIKFTPHPVLAGFLNGVALLIALGGLHVLLRGAGGAYATLCALVFAVALTALIFWLEQRKSRIPGTVVGLAVGVALFYGLGAVAPALPLGPTVGALPLALGGVLGVQVGADGHAALLAEAPRILLTAFVIALVATLDALLIARLARNLHPSPPDGRRYLVAQGLGNAAAGLLGGSALSASPSQTATAFSSGGRTKLVGVICALALLAGALVAPDLVSRIPQVVLCATLFANSIRVMDAWSLGLLRDVVLRRGGRRRGSTFKNLAVIVSVTAITATTSVSAGVLVGVVMSCLIFIVDMSRPLVRRRERADSQFSRRLRTERDIEILRSSGSRRAILELQGVMFFGNTDDLCTEIEALFKGADMILLDLRRVADIDVSAVGALEQAMSKARTRKKLLLFCGVPAPHVGLFTMAAQPASDAAVFPDRDTALEWMEEKVLGESGRSEFEEVPLEEVEFLHGLKADEVEVVRRHLMPMAFPAGTILSRQGEEADYLWILSSGSVSLLLGRPDDPAARRVASLARGTIVGEMTFLAGGTRSETVRADENVTGYMIDRDTFDQLLREHPDLGAKMLANIGREMARQLRTTYQILDNEAGGL